jgi:hypothetical protein
VGHLLVPLLEAYLVVRITQLAASKVGAYQCPHVTYTP